MVRGEVLEAFARQGHLMLMSQDERQFEQSTWVTRMARLAATEYHADWVINSDADEFWWPRARTLKEALAAVPERYGVVYAPICNFPPQRGDGPFYELMTVRVAQHAPLNNPLGRYRPSMKAAHRGVRAFWCTEGIMRSTTLGSGSVLGIRSRCCTFPTGRPSRLLASTRIW